MRPTIAMIQQRDNTITQLQNELELTKAKVSNQKDAINTQQKNITALEAKVAKAKEVTALIGSITGQAMHFGKPYPGDAIMETAAEVRPDPISPTERAGFYLGTIKSIHEVAERGSQSDRSAVESLCRF